MGIIVNKPKQIIGIPVLDLGNGPSKQTEKIDSSCPGGDSLSVTKANNRFECAFLIADSWPAKISSSRIDRSLDASGTVFADTLFRRCFNRSKCLHWLAYVSVMAVT